MWRNRPLRYGLSTSVRNIARPSNVESVTLQCTFNAGDSCTPCESHQRGETGRRLFVFFLPGVVQSQRKV